MVKIDKISKILKNIVDIILIVLLTFLSIKKGGFYKNDNLEFNLIVTFIGTGYIFFSYIINILKKYIRKKNLNESQEKMLNKKRKFDVIEILLLLLCFSYLLPIIFNNYSNLSDSIFEMVRYFNIYIIYVIVKKSDNKKLYINGILGIVLIQCLLGVDGLANKYFLPMLNKLNSGYLTSDNLTRMSATIQYANVFSLLCILADIYVIDKFKNIKNITSQNLIEYFLIFVFTSSIILSKSRIILTILICYLVYIFISKKSNNKFLIVLNVLFSIIYTTIFMKLLHINISAVYPLTFSFYMLVIILYILRDRILKLLIKTLDAIYKKIKNKKLVYAIIISLLGIYLILAFCIKTPIKLNYDVNQNFVSRNIYDLNEGVSNKISIKIKRDHEDSRYKIDIYEVNEKSVSTLVKTYNYYYSITDTFKFDYTPKEDFKNLIVKITCEKNNIQVSEILVNNKTNYIDYLFLPTDIVYRTIDTLNGDSSFKDRLYFTKDAISLIKLNHKNFLIGLGGEGFKNTYELVKSNNYSSTEVHNVYLQIFVESGVIGFVIFASLIIIALKNSKLDIIKLLFIVFGITSLFDLNFSYMFSMAVFALLLALLNKKDLNKNNVNNVNNTSCLIDIFECIKGLIVTIYGVFVFVILLKSNIAYYTKVPKLDENNFSFEQIVESVQKQEKRVDLDSYENTYRYSLHLEYEKYLNVLESYLEETKKDSSEYSKSIENIKLLEEEIKSVETNMEYNLLQIKKNDKYESIQNI